MCHASQGGDPPEQSPFQPLRIGPTPKIPVIVEGIEVEALIDTGCPAMIISKTLCRHILDGEHNQENSAVCNEHRCKMEKRLHLSEPSLQLHAYCGTELSIGAEITVTLVAGEYKAKDVVLIQENTPVDLLLSTNLLPKLGIKVLDARGQSLLNDLENLTTEERLDLNGSPQLLNDQENLTSPATEERLDLNSSPQQPLLTETPQFVTEGDVSNSIASKPKQPFPCRTISGSCRKVPAPMSRQKAVVHLVRACKLPALSGKLLQARVCQGQLSPSHQLFEPNSHLHRNQTVDIPTSLLLSCKNCSYLFITLQRHRPGLE